MGRTSFENLLVYRLAEDLADAVWAAALTWTDFDRDTIGRQFVRAADSVGANIAEGAGRDTDLDNGRFLSYARGSLYEVKHWLRRAWRRGLLTDEQTAAIAPLVTELLPRLSAYRAYVAHRSGH